MMQAYELNEIYRIAIQLGNAIGIGVTAFELKA